MLVPFLSMTTTHDRSGHCRVFNALADQGVRAFHIAVGTALVWSSLPVPPAHPRTGRTHAPAG